MRKQNNGHQSQSENSVRTSGRLYGTRHPIGRRSSAGSRRFGYDPYNSEEEEDEITRRRQKKIAYTHDAQDFSEAQLALCW